MNDEIKVGDWVWVWRWLHLPQRPQWARIVRIEDGRAWCDLGGNSGGEKAWLSDCEKNPIIPPKPKKMVTKEAVWLGTSRPHEDCFSTASFHVPYRAVNVKCTYEIEE